MFLRSFNYFRGIAIIFVVLAHSYIPAGWQPDSTLDRFMFDLMMNGTVFFVFISGFLFHHVFVPRYQYRAFMWKKAQFVLLPYLLLSVVPIAFWLLAQTPLTPPHQQLAAPDTPLGQVGWYLLTGRQLTAYWYIPMVMVLFAITPLVVWLDKHHKLLHAALPLLLVALLIHRPFGNLSALQSLCYFLPVFLIGAWSSQHKQWLYQTLHRREWLLIAVALGLAAVQALYTDQVGNSHKAPFVWAGIDLSLLQKLLLCLALMVGLHRFEDRHWPWLDKLAQVSFAVFFIHPWFTTAWKFWHPTPADYPSGGNLLTTLLVCALLISASMAVAQLFKWLFKRHSRYLIGW